MTMRTILVPEITMNADDSLLLLIEIHYWRQTLIVISTSRTREVEFKGTHSLAPKDATFTHKKTAG